MLPSPTSLASLTSVASLALPSSASLASLTPTPSASLAAGWTAAYPFAPLQELPTTPLGRLLVAVLVFVAVSIVAVFVFKVAWRVLLVLAAVVFVLYLLSFAV